MQIRKSHIILYVQDQKLSKEFYADILEKDPILDVPGMTEFELSGDVVLGLMPNDGIAKIISPQLPHPKNGTGIPRCELYLYVSEIQNQFKRLKNKKVISPLEIRNWGDFAFYLADPDGHVIAFAEKI